MVESTFSKIDRLINSSRFNEAFLLLKRELFKYPNLSGKLENLKEAESTYKHMLAFLAVGHDDPGRKDMTDRIREALYDANETVARNQRLVDSSDIYSSTRRLFNLRKETLASLLKQFSEIFNSGSSNDNAVSDNLEKITSKQAQVLEELFNYVWTMKGENINDYDTLSQALGNDELPEYFKILLVSAVVLGNLDYFDPNSYELLIQTYETSSSINVKARALTGILLIALVHPHRVTGNLNIKSRLMLSTEDEELRQYLNDILLNIIRTYDTKRVDSKMRNEVIPGLMKIKPEIIEKMRNMASDSENFLSDANPEWEEMIENSDIGKKLQEINDMQLEGADVMVTAFSNLKTFPFFNSVANWFMPFVPGYFEFDQLPIQRDADTVGRLTSVMCDSDLHSFLLSLKQMPESNRNQMLKNMEMQMKEAQEALSDAIGETDKKKLQRKIRHALMDLYRFFKFFRKKNEFQDPFERPFLAEHIEKIMPWFGVAPINVRLVAEFYFKNKYYEEAAGMFTLYDRLEPGNFNIWEKIGFSFDRLQDFESAVKWYRKAEIVNPDNPWLDKKLAVALKNSGNTEEAKKYYRKSLEREPENYHLLMSMAQCLIDTGDTEQALKHLYHAQYLKPDKHDVKRAIAWAYLMEGNFEKANEQYVKVMVHPEADATDFLNAAHSLLASGNFKDALKNYRSFVEKTPQKDITSLVLAFRDDAAVMKKLGIKTSDLRLIVDKIRYDIL